MRKISKLKFFTVALTLVLGLTMVGAGIAGAATGGFQFHSTTANVEVDEALSVSCVGGDGLWTTGTWSVSAYPGETKSITLRITNSGSADIVATVGESTGILSGIGDYTVPASGYVDVSLSLKVGVSVPPSTYTYYITFQR